MELYYFQWKNVSKISYPVKSEYLKTPKPQNPKKEIGLIIEGRYLNIEATALK